MSREALASARAEVKNVVAAEATSSCFAKTPSGTRMWRQEERYGVGEKALLEFLSGAIQEARALSVVMRLDRKRDTDRSALEAVLEPGDIAGWLDDNTFVVAMCDQPARVVHARAEHLSRVLGGGVGLAQYPDDGDTAIALLEASSRSALRSEGALPGAAHCVRRIDLAGMEALVGDSEMIELFELIAMLARRDLSVLLWGETGAGKELAARALHVWSPRASGPFVAINCAAIPEALIESELYGYERGAFSGASNAKPGRLETAVGGTLFLDEVGELSLGAQAKLLRALETRRTSRVGAVREYEFDVRLVAASNRDLQSEVQDRRFRRDLYYRLNGATLTVPPLRERPHELLLLTQCFLQGACTEGKTLAVSPAALARLQAYSWPGNVRELRNEMEYLAATVRDAVIEPAHLSRRLAHECDAAPSPGHSSPRFRPIADEVRELETRRMREALAAADGVQTTAAQLIGMPLRTFTWKYKQYALAEMRRENAYTNRPTSTRKSS